MTSDSTPDSQGASDDNQIAYAQHLATINKTQNVKASSDICNSQGQILVKEGARIDQPTVDRITKFKLLKPLEESVSLENEFTEASLKQKIADFFRSNASLSALFDLYNDDELLGQCCAHTCQFPLLKQKFSVVASILPNVFDQAIFCAWLGMIISTKSKAEKIVPENVFLAGLCHDIGMVHISAEVLNKNTELTLDEWKQIQAHPIISYNIVKETPGIPPSVPRAILEHHENLDGSGYPKGKHLNDLSSEGQLLNLLDSVNAIFTKRFKPFNRSIKGLIPIIQINRHSRISHAGKYLILLLKALPDDPTTMEVPEIIAPRIIETIKDRIDYITKCLNTSITAASSLGFKHQTGQLNSIQNAIIHITMTLTQSGFVNDAYKRWVDQVFDEKLAHSYKEVEDAYLMMQEIIYHISKLKLQIAAHLDKNTSGQGNKALQDCLDGLSTIELPEVDPTLAQMWLFKSSHESDEHGL